MRLYRTGRQGFWCLAALIKLIKIPLIAGLLCSLWFPRFLCYRSPLVKQPFRCSPRHLGKKEMLNDSGHSCRLGSNACYLVLMLVSFLLCRSCLLTQLVNLVKASLHQSLVTNQQSGFKSFRLIGMVMELKHHSPYVFHSS